MPVLAKRIMKLQISSLFVCPRKIDAMSSISDFKCLSNKQLWSPSRHINKESLNLRYSLILFDSNWAQVVIRGRQRHEIIYGSSNFHCFVFIVQEVVWHSAADSVNSERPIRRLRGRLVSQWRRTINNASAELLLLEFGCECIEKYDKSYDAY